MKILVVDDAPEIVEVASLCLELRWPEVTVVSATEGKKGLELIETEHPDLVILDIGLPDIDGFEVLQQIRCFSDVPVIMLTVRDEDTSIVRALELGADDYITKPFSHIELLARVQALLRRAKAAPLRESERPFISGNLSVDLANREVRIKGKLVKLTPIEYNLLYHLIRNEGTVLTHRALLTKVWGPEYTDAPEYLKVHVQRLRQKLGDNPHSPQMIVTERGVGYRFVGSR